jgi:hypothetical protein
MWKTFTKHGVFCSFRSASTQTTPAPMPSSTHDATYVTPLDRDFLKPAGLDLAYQFARKAVQLDPNLPEAHAVLGFLLAFKHRHDASMASIERVLALNPNYIDWRFGYPLVLAGHSRRSIQRSRSTVDPKRVRSNRTGELALAAGSHHTGGIRSRDVGEGRPQLIAAAGHQVVHVAYGRCVDVDHHLIRCQVRFDSLDEV